METRCCALQEFHLCHGVPTTDGLCSVEVLVEWLGSVLRATVVLTDELAWPRDDTDHKLSVCVFPGGRSRWL